MSADIIHWDFERSRKRKEKGLAPEKIKLEKVLIPEDWSAEQYEKFRDILVLLCGIDEEQLPQVWCMITDLVSARLGCTPGTLIDALGGIVEHVVEEEGAFNPELHSEEEPEG